VSEHDDFVHEVEELRVTHAWALVHDLSGLLAVASEESPYAREAWDRLQEAQRHGLTKSLRLHDAALIESLAEIAAEYAEEARGLRDGSDYPESWIGMQYHGQYHGATDVAIRLRARAREVRGEEE